MIRSQKAESFCVRRMKVDSEIHWQFLIPLYAFRQTCLGLEKPLYRKRKQLYIYMEACCITRWFIILYNMQL